jgi:prepilin-type N-terminal cleavage/methylation domain-containing protein
MPGRTERQAGFTLIELSIALVLLIVGLLIAGDLLMETAQLFAETSGESLDTPVPLVVARIRGDVQGGIGVAMVRRLDGSLGQVVVQGLSQQIVYEKQGDTLVRTVTVPGSPPRDPETLWRRVVIWNCQTLPGTSLVQLSVTYQRRAVPHSPLPGLPVDRGPKMEMLIQSMFLLPRGAGLGDTW